MGSSLVHQTSKKIVWFQHTQVLHVQRAFKDKWAKYEPEPVQMPLADYTAAARLVKTLICSKLSTIKPACLNLTSGPRPPQGTGIHVVKSVLAQPVPYTLGTSKFTYVHMEPFSITWNPSPCKPCILVCTNFTHGLHPLLLGAHAGPLRIRNDADNSLWHASGAGKRVSGWVQFVWILGKTISIPKEIYLRSLCKQSINQV